MEKNEELPGYGMPFVRGEKRNGIQLTLQKLKKKLATEPRSYSSRQLCNYLKDERSINISERHLKRILKKKV